MKILNRIPVTRKGYEKLKIDLKDLKESRPDAVNTLSEARKMGDLSENGLYTAAKMRLRSMDSQILRLSTQIKLADIMEDNKKHIITEIYLWGDRYRQRFDRCATASSSSSVIPR